MSFISHRQTVDSFYKCFIFIDKCVVPSRLSNPCEPVSAPLCSPTLQPGIVLGKNNTGSQSEGGGKQCEG